MKRLLALSSLIALTAVVGACGGSDSDSDAEAKDTPVEQSADAAGDEHAAGSHDMEGMDHSAGDMEGMDHGAGAHDHADGGADGGADKGLGMLSNGHHEAMEYTELDAPTQEQLDQMIELSRQAVADYPTLADAHAAGWRNAGPFSPGLGLHVTAKWAAKGMNPDGVVDAEDASNPMIVIYDGTDPAAKVAGFMYYSVAEDQPEGFPGKNDFWHYHTNVCAVFTPEGTEAPFGADRSVSKKQCDSVGGVLMPKTQWMVHVWSIPGYEVDQADGGIFAEVNPKLDCPDGSYYIMPMKDWKDHPESICKSELN